MIPAQGSPAHAQLSSAKRGPPRLQVCSSSPFSPKANLARCRKTLCLKATDPSHPPGWSEGHQSLEAGKPDLGVRNHNGNENGQSRPGEGQWLTQHICGYYSKTWHRGIHFKPSMWLNLLFGWWSHVFGHWGNCLPKEENQRKKGPINRLLWLVASSCSFAGLKKKAMCAFRTWMTELEIFNTSLLVKILIYTYASNFIYEKICVSVISF